MDPELTAILLELSNQLRMILSDVQTIEDDRIRQELTDDIEEIISSISDSILDNGERLVGLWDRVNARLCDIRNINCILSKFGSAEFMASDDYKVICKADKRCLEIIKPFQEYFDDNIDGSLTFSHVKRTYVRSSDMYLALADALKEYAASMRAKQKSDT